METGRDEDLPSGASGHMFTAPTSPAFNTTTTRPSAFNSFIPNIDASSNSSYNPAESAFSWGQQYGVGDNLGGFNLGFSGWGGYGTSNDCSYVPTTDHFNHLSTYESYISTLSQPDSNSGSESGIFNASYSSSLNGASGSLDFQEMPPTSQQVYSDRINQWSSPYPAGKTYDPFGTADVLHNVDTRSSSPASSTSASNPKPSYSDVTKNKPPMSQDKGQNKTSRVGSRHEPRNEFPAFNPTSGKGSYKKVRSSKNYSTRHKAASIEPTVIKPNSRYGLDTFDDNVSCPNKVDKTRKYSQASGSAPQSRKGSTSGSSISGSSVSGVDDIQLGNVVNAYDIPGPGPGVGVRFDSKTGDSLSVEENVLHSPKPNFENTKEKPLTDTKDKRFFDPKRIFRNSEKKASPATPVPNCYPPNNQQDCHKKEADVLNNGKPKPRGSAGVSRPGSARYINNDLRDKKKQTNTERRNCTRVAPPPGRAESAPHYRNQDQPESTHNTEENNPHQTRQTKAHSKESRTAASANTCRKPNPEHWLFVVLLWCLSCSWELVLLLWSVIKLVLSVLGYGAILSLHSLVLLFCKFVQLITSRFYESGGRASSDGNDKSASGKSFLESRGLKENIPIPTTGEEAMRRLLACKGKDPYSILGLRADASDDEIKKYYRRQAVLVHPDKNSQPGSEEAFKVLGHAFDLIGEPEKRKAYDAQQLEAQEVDQAMQEFADLLTKLQEKMQEAANLILCDRCGGKHKRIPTNRPTCSARFCDRCNMRHSAKEGDVWAESGIFGFLWHYYACMDGQVFDVTDWASCQEGHFKHITANSHSVRFKISTKSSRQRQNPTRTNEADLEDILKHIFQHSQQNGGPTEEAFTGNPGQKRGSQPASSKRGRRRKRKH